jgi:hypothetical protein
MAQNLRSERGEGENMESFQLARTQGHETVNDLKDIEMTMTEYISTEHDAALETAVERINKITPGLLEKLFPNFFENAFKREDRRIALDRMRTVHDKKKQILELYTAFRLEIARRECDALLASKGMQLQAGLAAFATQKIDQLDQTLGESRQKFLARIKPQLEELETYKTWPELYDAAKQSITNEWKTYFATADELLRGFTAALKSKIQA